MIEQVVMFALRVGWGGFLGGVIAGAVIGMKFHQETWMGGYGSRERRMLRLGHISFFGIGMMSLFYGLSLRAVACDVSLAKLGAMALAIAVVAMPSVCFLTAWRTGFRHFFFIPVLAAATGICIQLKMLL